MALLNPATDDSSSESAETVEKSGSNDRLHSEFQDVLEALSARWSGVLATEGKPLEKQDSPPVDNPYAKKDGGSKTEGRPAKVDDKKNPDRPAQPNEKTLYAGDDPVPFKPVQGTPLDVSKLATRLEDNFKRIDKNKDGFISDVELLEAVRNPDIEGDDALLVGLLRISKPTLAENPIALLHLETEFGIQDQNKGISKKDATIYLNLLSLSQLEGMSISKLMERIQEQFSDPDFHRSVNPNQDNLITDDELKAARSSPKLTEGGKILIDLLLRNRELLTKFSNDKEPNKSLTFDALRDLRSLSEVLHRSETSAHSFLERFRTEGKVSRELFGDKSKPLNSIRPEAVKQGGVGSCFFLSAVGSLATHDPDRLLSMIKVTDKGDFEVRFPGAKGKIVTVPRPTDTELFLYAGATEHGIWVNVLEKAYGKLLNENPEFRPEAYIDASSPENLDAGGRDEALKLLTGADTKEFIIECDNQEELKKLKGELALAKKRGDIAIAATLSDRSWVLPDLQPGHAYMVTGFDDSTITVRNVWGIVRLGMKNGMPSVRQGDTGNLKLTHEEFAKKFGNIVFAPSRKK